MNRDTLIFDLDGTLADTAPDLVATLNRIGAPRGLPAVDTKDIGQIVGHGAKAMIRQSFALAEREAEDGEVEAMFDDFLSDYSVHLADKTVLFEQVAETLDALSAKGFILCVCTNKTERFAVRLLEELNTLDRFASLSGGDTFEFRKPDARHLEETAKAAGSSLERSIMIGDSSTDINAAINAGIPSIAVTFGYSDKPVTELDADAIISNYRELPGKIEAIRQRGS